MNFPHLSFDVSAEVIEEPVFVLQYGIPIPVGTRCVIVPSSPFDALMGTHFGVLEASPKSRVAEVYIPLTGKRNDVVARHKLDTTDRELALALERRLAIESPEERFKRQYEESKDRGKKPKLGDLCKCGVRRICDETTLTCIQCSWKV
jgi:hypothetical protein